jgi:two-component system OmpR family response regulator
VPDAVILELQLATGSGLTVLRHLRWTGRKILVIVLTNHSSPSYRQACLAEGADHFLDKSAEFEKVAEILGKAAAR